MKPGALVKVDNLGLGVVLYEDTSHGITNYFWVFMHTGEIRCTHNSFFKVIKR